jgi:hypothetical protein
MVTRTSIARSAASAMTLPCDEETRSCCGGMDSSQATDFRSQISDLRFEISEKNPRNFEVERVFEFVGSYESRQL